MEAFCVALRPKQNATVTQEFSPRTFDVLLTDIRSDGEKAGVIGGGVKDLPHTPLSYEEEPTDHLLTFIYDLTGAEIGGLKGKRAVFVPTRRHETKYDSIDVTTTGTLYCVPIDSRNKLNPKYVDTSSKTPGFYSLDVVLETLDTMAENYTQQTRVLLMRMESWLREKHNVPGAVDLLFSSSTEDRLNLSVANPAYFAEGHASMLGLGHLGESYSRSIANEALARMMSIEKCDITVMNPLFRAPELRYRNTVEAFTINPYWRRGKPDLSQVKRVSLGGDTSSNSSDSSWRSDYPLHKWAVEGDANMIRELIQQGATVAQRDQQSWAPIHYAAWFGHIEALAMLLQEGECPPNLITDNGSTALHFAAARGHPCGRVVVESGTHRRQCTGQREPNSSGSM